MDSLKWNGRIHSRVFFCVSFFILFSITVFAFYHLKNEYILYKYAAIGYISSQKIDISDAYIKDLIEGNSEETYIKKGITFLDKAGYYTISEDVLSKQFYIIFYSWLFLVLLLFIICLFYIHIVKNRYKTFFSQLEQWVNYVDPMFPPIITNHFKENSLSLLIDSINKKFVNIKQVILNLRKENEKASNYVDDVLHQLKTPLAILDLLVDRLSYQEVNPKKLKKLNEASLQIEKMTSIIKDILRLSRLKSGKVIFNIRESDFNKNINEVIHCISPLAQEKNIEIQSIIEDKVRFEFDEIWLKECILNIMKNCLEYSECNSSVVINYKKNYHHHCITITDEGVGIDEGEEELIFNRFYSKDSSNSKDNIGIGLNLAKEIILYHHGRLWAENNEKKGVTFTILLPILSGDAIYQKNI